MLFCWISLLRQSKDRPRNAEPSQLKFAYWHKLCRAMAGELSEAIIVRPNSLDSFSMRAAGFTAGPMQVKSSRLPLPMFPYRTSPT